MKSLSPYFRLSDLYTSGEENGDFSLSSKRLFLQIPLITLPLSLSAMDGMGVFTLLTSTGAESSPGGRRPQKQLLEPVRLGVPFRRRRRTPALPGFDSGAW